MLEAPAPASACDSAPPAPVSLALAPRLGTAAWHPHSIAGEKGRR